MFPAAFQSLPPFGVSTGGTNPAYWPYNEGCQFDSWLTVGAKDGSGGLGNVGIDFDTWDERTQLGPFDNGAVFSMSPSESAPLRSSATDSTVEVALAQLTIPTNDEWEATVGAIQGRSVNVADGDWELFDLTYTWPLPELCTDPPPSVLAAYANVRGSRQTDSFAVTATCAAGYSGTAEISPCSIGGTPWGVSGCSGGSTVGANYQCSSRGGFAQGYQLTEISLAARNFQVIASCADGWSGYAVVTPCTYTNGPYSVSGCTMEIAPPSPPSDPCGHNPCQHGGVCQSALGTYRCACTAGYTGNNCENPAAGGTTDCTDDARGELANIGYTCAAAIADAQSGGGCAFDMYSAGLQGMRQGDTLAVLCPHSCRQCGGGHR